MMLIIVIMVVGIKLSEPMAIIEGKVSVDISWDHRGERLALQVPQKIVGTRKQAMEVKTAEEIGDGEYEWTINVISIWEGNVLNRITEIDSNCVYSGAMWWSPDDKRLLCLRYKLSRYTISDYVIIDIDRKEIIEEIPYERGNICLHGDSLLVWNRESSHELKWVSHEEYHELLREQKHHWPEWVKQLIKEGARRVLEYREQKKMGVKEIKLTKSLVVPGHFFVKVLERDEDGYVKKAQLWAYPEGKEPYLAMDENIYGIIRCFSPDHRYMIIQGKDNHLYIARADGSDVTRVTEKAKEDYYYFGIYWAPDSKKFAYIVTSKKYPQEKGVYLVRIKE